MRQIVSDHVVCNMDELGDTVKKILKEYAEETKEKVDEAVTEVSRNTKKIIKANANRGVRKVYYKSFRTHTEDTLFGRDVTIHSKKHEYSLTHLLEHGHELWNRPEKPTRAFPHWKKGEDYAVKNLPKKIIEKIEGD